MAIASTGAVFPWRVAHGALENLIENFSTKLKRDNLYLVGKALSLGMIGESIAPAGLRPKSAL